MILLVLFLDTSSREIFVTENLRRERLSLFARWHIQVSATAP